ncbi:MAG: RsiV family protein [Mucilaginibacter sp.]
MKLKSILFLSIVVLISSCINSTNQQKKQVSLKDTLKYTYETVKERSSDCGTKPDSGCTMAVYNYPVFKDKKGINDTLNRILLNFFNSDKNPDTSIRQSARLFLTSYGNFKRSYPKSPLVFKLNSYAKVLHQDSSLTTVEAGITVFMGGGGTIVKFLNWDTGADKKIGLNDLFIDGYQEKLTQIAESIFRKNEKLSDAAPLTGQYRFKENKFALNDNFVVTPLGIRFLYNQNEIKPHEAGSTELILPYAEIKSLLKPNTVLDQFTK